MRRRAPRSRSPRMGTRPSSAARARGLRRNAAWVFARNGVVWSQRGSKLGGDDAAGTAGLGASVAISGDGTTVIVGGPGDADSSGAAWVFSAPAFTAWVPVASHMGGLNQSQWRSDLGLLNTGSVTANVQLKFFGRQCRELHDLRGAAERSRS